MGREYELRRVQRLPLPPERVFDFFVEARNLEAITPPSLQFHIITDGPIEIRSGTIIDYRLKLSGIPFRWQSVIEEFNPPRQFVDRQVRGPYAAWHHTHSFAPVAGERGEITGTDMTDLVRYRMPLGPLGTLVHALFVRPQLNAIFDFRNKKLVELITPARFADTRAT
jgi:ligand-binding SRPBCC domain-containing protein